MATNTALQKAIERLIRTEGQKRYQEEFVPDALASLCDKGHLNRGTPEYEKANGWLYLMGTFLCDYSDNEAFLVALEHGEIEAVD